MVMVMVVVVAAVVVVVVAVEVMVSRKQILKKNKSKKAAFVRSRTLNQWISNQDTID